MASSSRSQVGEPSGGALPPLRVSGRAGVAVLSVDLVGMATEGAGECIAGAGATGRDGVGVTAGGTTGEGVGTTGEGKAGALCVTDGGRC